jgi:hypothetical protein
VLSNIENLLDVKLPIKQLSGDQVNEFGDDIAETLEAQCDICYSYLRARDDSGGAANSNTSSSYKQQNDLPDQLCTNKACHRSYHTACILSTLRAKGGRDSLGCMYGNCPFCFEPMVVKYK